MTEAMSQFWQTICVILVSVLIAASFAYGHPGGLNDENCHRVREEWKYKSGRVLKAGSYHCHGRLNDLSLDGRNMLEDPDDKGEPVKKEKAKKK